ncbi:MAG TPA: hypothetical protein VGQ37_27670 [Vicinamibacterales bacterium]|jgi:hypothetical protein|nr:hypothetical protein [Vicinamibacterales bacterium]
MTLKALVLIAMLGVASEAGADAIYTYAGHSYTDIVDVPLPGGTFDTSMSVSGEFGLASALPPEMPATDITSLITSFTFSNGRNTLTNLAPLLNVALFSVATDAFGAISAWAISIQQLDAVNGGVDVIIQTVNDPDIGFPTEDRGQLEACDPMFLPRGLCITLADVASVGLAGGWERTESGTETGTVPEPATLGLCALGFWAIRCRRAR